MVLSLHCYYLVFQILLLRKALLCLSCLFQVHVRIKNIWLINIFSLVFFIPVSFSWVIIVLLYVLVEVIFNFILVILNSCRLLVYSVFVLLKKWVFLRAVCWVFPLFNKKY